MSNTKPNSIIIVCGGWLIDFLQIFIIFSTLKQLRNFFPNSLTLIAHHIQMQSQQRQKVSKLELNKTDIARLGFDLSSQKPLFHEFISPYEQDQQRPHPLLTEIPQGFTTFEFQFDKVSNRLVEDTFIYIFYNVIDERLQLQAGRNLMDKGLNYHKKYKIWVRKKDSKFQYFNISEWKYIEFNQPVLDEDYYTKEDFAEKTAD